MNKTTFDQLRNELHNKIRTVKDISRYVDKKEELSPNYSIFLGAGASVTSKISSGGNLVEEWRNEIFLHECKDIDHNHILSIKDENERRDKIIHELIKLPGGWYNPQNEYSSLFEKKFDLPSQRRRFVEGLVDDKLPSIGYLYLISLINKKYFNTVFTTNFDDLVNEAFYHFSNTRPYVCAHDSSIGSLSVLSKRPQIIKLHGDYLFDDIKNTLRETESLETNTREKFIEFSKDSGIIIVGYSGQDRSIMDVLNYLVQQEEYLKNGIYWCFRKGDEISQDLRKLLWRDKVYCIEVEGFDQFFAELSTHLNCPISIRDENIDSKRGNTIKLILKDEYLLRGNKIIDKDIEELESDSFKTDISNFIREINENINSNMSSVEFRDLYEIESLIQLKKYEEVLAKIELKEENSDDDDYDYKFLKLKVYKVAKMDDKALKLIDELLKSDPFNVRYCFLKADYLKKNEEKIDYLKKCNLSINNSIELKNKIIYESLSYYDHFDKEYISFEDCITIADESIGLDPSLGNDAYIYKSSLLKRKKLRKGLKVSEVNSISMEIESLIEDISKINKNHLNYFKIKSEYILLDCDIDKILNFIDELLNGSKDVSIDEKKFLYSKLSEDLLSYSVSEKLADLRGKARNGDANNSKILEFDSKLKSFFYEDDLELKKGIIQFIIKKSNLLISKERDLEAAIDVCKLALKCNKRFDYIRSIVDIFILDKNNKERIEYIKNYVIENKSKIDVRDYNLTLVDLYESTGNSEESLRVLDDFFYENKDDYSYILKSLYNFILCGKYSEAIDLYHRADSHLKKFDQGDRDIIALNYYLAKKKNETLDEKDKLNIRTIVGRSGKDKDILIGCNCLLDNEQAIKQMKEQIEIDFKKYFNYLEWPIINSTYKEKLKIYIQNHFKVDLAS